MPAADLLGETKRRILGHLVWGEGTAADVARAAGVNRAAARRHLDRLEALEFVKPHCLRRGVGRPRKYYALAPEGREALGKRYDLMLNLLLSEIVEREGKPQAREHLRAIARGVAQQVQRGAGPLEDRLRALVTAFNGLGFPTTLEQRDGRWAIIKRDCILYRVARQHQDLICDFDNEIIRSTMGDVEVELRECLGKGDGFCRQVVLPLQRADGEG